MSAHRVERLASDIKRQLTIIIAQRVDDPSVEGVTVEEVELSRDCKNANVYVMVANDDKNVVKALSKCAGYIRNELVRSMPFTRQIPILHFILDTTATRASRIDFLLGNLNKDGHNTTD